MATPPKGLGNYQGVQSPLPMRRTIRKAAAQYIDAAAPVADVSVTFFARNPSPRLRWSITVGWEFDDYNALVAGAATPTWQMRAVRFPPGGGAPADLDYIFVDSTGAATPRDLPDGYEVDSAVKAVRGTLNLHNGAGQDIDSGLFGFLVIEATWEPHDGYTDRDEIWQLLQEADLWVIADAPVQLSNGT